jgi:hypothetical protein
MFALPTPTAGKVRTFNLHTEHHGDDEVTAMDLGVRITGPSSLLDLLHSNLREMLYLPPLENQASIPGESAPWTVLRCDAAKAIPVKHELVGRNIVLEPSSEIESELRADDLLELSPCNVNKFLVTAFQGGSVYIDFRIQCNNVDQAAIGAGGAMLNQEVKLSVTHTAVDDQAGSTADEGGAADEEEGGEPKDATTLFAEAEAAADAERGEGWPFPPGGAAAVESPPAHMREPKISKKARKALGKP